MLIRLKEVELYRLERNKKRVHQKLNFDTPSSLWLLLYH